MKFAASVQRKLLKRKDLGLRKIIYLLTFFNPSYDRYLLLNHLSSDVNFRWCLSTTCTNGQLYEETEGMDPHIACEECEFEMCFRHQMPWHEGVSCEQYDNDRLSGDPNYQQTHAWLGTNSKNCPSCGVSIEKDGGCFHMTCTSLMICQSRCGFANHIAFRRNLSPRVLLGVSCSLESDSLPGSIPSRRP